MKPRPQAPVVILANGDYPRAGSPARKLLDSAALVVACDGAANAYRRRTGRWPDLIVGDMDSFRPPKTTRTTARTPQTLRIPDQETNDLEKAVAACRARGWLKPVVVGATGRREDHTLGNVFRALTLDVEIVTDFGRFIPVTDRFSCVLKPGTGVSIFAPERDTRVVSTGLKWPLDNVRFDTLYGATLNRASASRITLRTTRPILVFIANSP